mgnify:CR=1 FL=1
MSNLQRFTNKVVIVTGSAQGIGRGVALQVAAEGGQVVMTSLSVITTISQLRFMSSYIL